MVLMELNAKKALVIINGTAGTGKAGAVEDAVVEALYSNGYEVSLSKIGSGEKAVDDAGSTDDSGIVVCCGGDGTFNRIVNRYTDFESAPTFAYIPCGLTNSFAKSLGLTEDAEASIDNLLNGKSCRCDIGKVNEHVFNYVASFASASSMNYVTSEQMKNVFGYSKYILRAIGELNMNMGDSFHMAIETDAGSFEDDYFFGAISNLSVIDGTNLNNESFKNNDGFMELLLIRKPDSRSQAKEALKALQDSSVDHPLIQISQIKKASFISGSDIAWSFDGEFGGIQKEAGLEVLKEALTVLGGQQSA